jgi:hypothetical protein
LAVSGKIKRIREPKVKFRFFNKVEILFVVFMMLAWGKTGAAEVPVFSGTLSEEAGLFQGSEGSLPAYQYSRLLLQSRNDFTSSLSLDLAGEAHWQTSAQPLFPSWPVDSVRNLVNLEADHAGSPNGIEQASLRLSRAFVKWVSGRLEVSAGLQNFNWGSSHFYQPTNYFYPLAPLTWEKDLPLGSEAVDASCFLFDDLSLEGATRWLEGGAEEWVWRLVNKGIGITATPSFAVLNGRDGLGLELSGTFPDFQLRVEGVDWLYPNGTAQTEWVLGFSTVRKGIAYTLEMFRDETGSVLGADNPGMGGATYLFTSMEKSFEGEWKITPGLLKGIEGGPFMFWPKVSWGFSPPWVLAFQGQLRIGTVPGPLALIQNRVGLSVSYSF